VLNSSCERTPDVVEHPRAVLRDERAGGGEVLPQHDLGRFVGEELVGSVSLGQAGEGRVEVGWLVAGLFEFVGVTGDLDTAANGRVGVSAQPVRRFHDVGVGIVDDPAFDVTHPVIVA
jgi:hypothetical protein